MKVISLSCNSIDDEDEDEANIFCMRAQLGRDGGD